MARPRSADYDQHRETILRAAAILFAQRGYTAATMLQVAAASGISKATLYHYFSDKPALLEHIARGHVERLEALVIAAETEGRPAAAHLRELILRFMQAYAHAQAEHRVLTEDVKFLDDAARHGVERGQRRVVEAFAQAVAAARPDLGPGLHKPLAMLLFGMINWTFTWLRADGAMTHESLAPLVAELFLGGLTALKLAPMRHSVQEGAA